MARGNANVTLRPTDSLVSGQRTGHNKTNNSTASARSRRRHRRAYNFTMSAVNPVVDGFKPVPTGLCGCLLIMGASSVIFSEWAHLNRGKDKRNNRAVVVNVLQLQPNIH